jgi:hypothetical protein
MGCTQDLVVSCAVTLDVSTLTITSSATWADYTSGNDCFADCQIANTECESPPLVEGNYAVVYGSQVLNVNIPGDHDGAQCLTN